MKLKEENKGVVYNFRVYLAYFIAKFYQFVVNFFNPPNSIALPCGYNNMNWWHFTHFLCLLSNKIYPDNVPDDYISGAMANAIIDRLPKELRDKFILDLLKASLNDTNFKV